MSEVVAYSIVEIGAIKCIECAVDEQNYIIEIGRYDDNGKPEEFEADENGILLGYHEVRPYEYDFTPVYAWELDEDWICD